MIYMYRSIECPSCSACLLLASARSLELRELLETLARASANVDAGAGAGAGAGASESAGAGARAGVGVRVKVRVRKSSLAKCLILCVLR